MKEKQTLTATLTVTPGSILRHAKERPTGTAEASHPEMPEPSMQEIIAKLAYALWEQRGCPFGSPECDWQEAERQLSEPSGTSLLAE